MLGNKNVFVLTYTDEITKRISSIITKNPYDDKYKSKDYTSYSFDNIHNALTTLYKGNITEIQYDKPDEFITELFFDSALLRKTLDDNIKEMSVKINKLIDNNRVINDMSFKINKLTEHQKNKQNKFNKFKDSQSSQYKQYTENNIQGLHQTSVYNPFKQILPQDSYLSQFQHQSPNHVPNNNEYTKNKINEIPSHDIAEDFKNAIRIYVDGSFINSIVTGSQPTGAIGIYCPVVNSTSYTTDVCLTYKIDNQMLTKYNAINCKLTNNVCETIGILFVIDYLNDQNLLIDINRYIICSDSQYAIGFAKGEYSIKHNTINKPILDLLREKSNLYRNHISYRHETKSKSEGIKKADELSKK